MSKTASHFSEIEDLVKALPRDPAFEKAVQDLVKEQAVREHEEQGREDDPKWTGWGDYFRYAKFEAIWFLFRIDQKLTTAKNALQPITAVYDTRTETTAFINALEAGIREAVKDTVADTDAKDIYSEVAYDLRDQAEEARDPYGYRGLSRKNFYGSRNPMADLKMQQLAQLTTKQAADDEVLWDWYPLPESTKKLKIDMASYAGLMGIQKLVGRLPEVKISIINVNIKMQLVFEGTYLGGGTLKVVKSGESFQLESDLSSFYNPEGKKSSVLLPLKFSPPALGKDQDDALKGILLKHCIEIWHDYLNSFKFFRDTDNQAHMQIKQMERQKDELAKQFAMLADKIAILKEQRSENQKTYNDAVSKIS